MDEYKIEKKVISDVVILKFIGEITSNIDDNVKKILKEEFQDMYNIILDLTELKYLNSTGLGSIAAILRYARKNDGDIKICGLQSSVKKLFEITRLDKIFEVYEDITSAVESFE